MTGRPPSRASSWLTAIVLFPVLLLLGVLVGGLVATRVLSTSGGMGWDQLADTLGGVMVGGAAGLIAWVLAIRTLGTTGRLMLIGLAIAGSVASVLYLKATPVNVRTAPATEIPAPPVAPFSFQVSVAEGLEGPSPEARLPWQLLSVASNLSFTYVPPDRPDQRCTAIEALNTPQGIARLVEMRDVLSSLPLDIDCGEPCPACDEVSLQWFLDQDRSTLSITDRCWLTHEQIQPLRAATDAFVADYRNHATCEPVGR